MLRPDDAEAGQRRPRARPELLGNAEIAELAGVGHAAVVNWRRRYPDFPRPVAVLQCGPIFRGAAVRRWLTTKRPKVDVLARVARLRQEIAELEASTPPKNAARRPKS